MLRLFVFPISVLVSALSATSALACSSCGCNLTSDWLSQGLVSQPGTTLGVRYDFVPQTQLRTGATNLNSAAIGLPTSREIERNTDNHYLTASLDHAFSPVWAINLQVPLILRNHQTISPGDTVESASRTTGFGDIRATVRYQGFGGPGVTGVQFGLKLPTGAFHQTFRTGPSVGQPLDRDLQAGSGTTNATFGVYHFGRMAHDFDYMLQAQGEVPFAAREAFQW